MTYTAEQLKGLSPEGIATKCSPVHIENVIKDLIATALALMPDANRLDFLAQNEAWIAWSKDGESCRVFVRNEDGENLPMMGWVPEAWAHSAREAIDLAKKAP